MEGKEETRGIKRISINKAGRKRISINKVGNEEWLTVTQAIRFFRTQGHKKMSRQMIRKMKKEGRVESKEEYGMTMIKVFVKPLIKK